MSNPESILENVRWVIDSEPTIESDITINKVKLEDIWNSILFTEDTKIRCMLNNNDSFHLDIMVEKNSSVGDFLRNIYNFYQMPLKQEYLRKAFWKNRELKEDVIKYKARQETIQNEIEKIKNRSLQLKKDLEETNNKISELKQKKRSIQENISKIQYQFCFTVYFKWI